MRVCKDCGVYAMVPDGGCWLCINCGYSQCESTNFQEQQQVKEESNERWMEESQ